MSVVPGLTDAESDLITQTLRAHPEVDRAVVFGSRAKGTYTPASDVDIALWGTVDDMRAQSIAGELEELPLPYRFDVIAFARIRSDALRDHIERRGVSLYCKEESPSVCQKTR